jgi:putative DNA primase/helicase
VIILAAEDSVAHTTVPRLIAAGADLERVYFVQAAVAEDGMGQRMFNFQADLAKLKALIREIGDVALIIVDPVTAYLGKIDSHKNADVRAVLAPSANWPRRAMSPLLPLPTSLKVRGAPRPGRSIASSGRLHSLPLRASG